MFARKLKALGYPSISNFDHSDQKKIQELVIWLEDQKIRHYKIEDRAALRKTSDISSWQRAFSKYLDDLSCPHSDRTNSPVTTDWLLGLAVRLVYGENPQRYRKCTKQTNSASKGVAPSSNPLDSLDFDDEAMKAGITTLATLLQIPPHHDHKEVLKVDICSHSVYSKLSSLRCLVLLVDYVTEEAVKILRLLHIQNLRQLQSQINEALVIVQNVTANPKTDQRLGKIGR
ncbi:hypothetical protein EB796_023151 [Bugula neritina]|uniref:Uncharacterized protein n=1 Tax=Bugula neritina TaxID=10212 RepID=A0A7J7IXA1_BUGNE|nr:hypothetical protein EB796_023151 [Bugula neritina]